MQVKKYEISLEVSEVWEKKFEYKISGSEAVWSFAKECMKVHTWDREKMVAIAVNAKGDLIGFNIVSVGELSSTVFHPREIAKFLFLANAAAVILMHNHPSGDKTPSSVDIETTQKIKNAMEMIQIKLIDHVIIGENGYSSLAAMGLI